MVGARGSPAATLEAREGRTFIDGSRVAASPFDALRALAASRVLSPMLRLMRRS
ncbi:MAG: hypothetical protein R3C55_16295 [Parvularculaceae bacterium]